MRPGTKQPPGQPTGALEKAIVEILSREGQQPTEADIAAIRQSLQRTAEAGHPIDIDYELKFLSIITIRHKATLGEHPTVAKLLVLLLPALMLALAIGGATALVWLLGPKFHL